MLKRDITYKNPFTDDEVTESFYFNLTPRELTTLEASFVGGIAAFFEKLQRTESHKEALDFFQDLVLDAYGARSEDGRRFIKNKDVRDEFIEIGAWDALWYDLVTNQETILAFFLGVLPQDMREEIAKTLKENDGDVVKAAQLATAPRPPAPVPPTS